MKGLYTWANRQNGHAVLKQLEKSYVIGIFRLLFPEILKQLHSTY